MTSSLQIRATNAATQCEQTLFCALWRMCVLLTSHFLAFSYPRKPIRTSTIHCSHHRNANGFHFNLFSADLGQVTNNSFTWNVTLPAYWTVQISIEDANFDEGWSQAVRILHQMSSPPFPLSLTHGFLALYTKNHILDSSSTKQRS
jgi:hypothetical protein